jgi:hypothetical protein
VLLSNNEKLTVRFIEKPNMELNVTSLFGDYLQSPFPPKH